MPTLIYTTDHYLYTTKRDAFVLQLKDQSENLWFDLSNPLNIEVEKSQLEWLDLHGVNYARTCPPGVLEGWAGLYYVDFFGGDDPALIAYSKEFEDAEGVKSIFPDQFQMYYISYDQWVTYGKLAAYEQYLVDRELPGWDY